MKTILNICFLITFVGLILIGCSDKSISPVETAGVNDNPVVLQKETGPGAWIIRYEDNLAFWFMDDKGYILTLGRRIDPWSRCSGSESIDISSVKDIYLPDADPNLRRIVEQIKGKDLVAQVWYVDPWPSEYWETYCQFWSQVEPMEPFAVGTANFSLKDNDVFAWNQENNNSNAFGYKANGTLVGQDGKAYKLNLIYNVIWDGDDYSKFNEVYKFQLTPTGDK